jgi:RNA polymerase sigma factor (sigma-70 family)
MDAINIYLKELRQARSAKKVDSTNEETNTLILKIKAGDEKAKDELVKNYLLFVLKEAKAFANKGVCLSDLIAEGNVGLLKSVDKYDPSCGVFSSYAKLWIRQSIIRNCMMNRRVVRLPENVSNLMSTNRWDGPSFSEYSIDLPNDEGDTYAESLVDGGVHIPFMDEDTIITKNKTERVLSFLQNRDADIVKAHFGIGREEPLEVAEIAELFGLSTTRINQILRSSLKAMRVMHNSLPEVKVEKVEIVSAVYGDREDTVDVTDKVNDLYMADENVKVSNRLGGDPCPGIKKTMKVQYIQNDELMTKVFSEGSVLKF